MKKVIQLILLNGGIALANILTFSESVFDVSLAYGTILQRAIGITLIIMSVLIFAWGNYKILSHENEAEKGLREAKNAYGYVLEEIDTPEECLEALSCYQHSVFARDVDTAKDQVNRLVRKMASLKEILFQKCQAQQGELLGFQKVIEDCEIMTYENVKRILSRMAIFDQREYENLQHGRLNVSVNTLEAKRQIFAEHFAYIKQQLEKNEEILLEFDRLLMEVSKIGDKETADEDTMNGIRDVIHGMKQLHNEEQGEMEDLEQKYRGTAYDTRVKETNT